MENIRTDLAIEAHEMCSKKKAEEQDVEGVSVRHEDKDGITVTIIEVKNKKGEMELGKPKGKYVTIEAPDIKFSDEALFDTCEIISQQIKSLYPVTEATKTLVVGLGNDMITPDALGPKVVSQLMVTNHIKTYMQELLDETFGTVCAIVPGVLGTTGIETTDIIQGVCDKINPELVICVDALATRSVNRISTTVQISDTGISPGSGVENKREKIDEKSIGAKVISIGVPTVVDAATIASDSIDAILENNSELAEFCEGVKMRDIIKKALSGSEKNMMVTPKDIDLVVRRAAKVVADGINLALHGNLSF